MEYPLIRSLFSTLWYGHRLVYYLCVCTFFLIIISWKAQRTKKMMDHSRVESSVACAVSSKVCVCLMDSSIFIFLFSPVFVQKKRHMRRRKPHRPFSEAPCLNPMSSHSACSSREFCMTCTAPRDKGWMGCCCPHREVGVDCAVCVCGLRGGGWSQWGRREWVEEGMVVGKGVERGVWGVSSSTTSPAPWTLTSL